MFGNLDFENNHSITYSEAIRRKPKQKAGMVLITLVQWNKRIEKEATRKVKFPSLTEEVEVIVPKIVNDRLPYGYRMEMHESLEELRLKIYDPYNNKYTFEQLETFIEDSKVFEFLGIYITIPNREGEYYLDENDVEGDYPETHDEFWDWYYRYYDQWEELENEIKEYFDSTIDGYLRENFQPSEKPPQIPAPDKYKAIAQIIANLQSKLTEEMHR